MRAAVVVGVLSVAVGAARAEPDSADPDLAFAACKTRRRALTRDAMRIEDLSARGRALAAMPICRRLEDGSTEVVDVPATLREEPPFNPRVTLALRTGAAANTLWSDADPDTAWSPFVEVEVGLQPWRHVELAAFVGYSTLVGTIRAPLVSPTQTYEVRDQLYDAGVRAGLHYGAFAFGIGCGVMVEQGKGYADYHDYVNQLAELELHGSYTFARLAGAALELVGTASYARDSFVPSRELAGLRLGVGARL